MSDTLLAAYFGTWLTLALSSFVFFRGKAPAFKHRWHQPVAAINVAIIGGMIVLMVSLSGSWLATVIFTAGVLFFMWVSVFQTRVCLGCGKFCKPENLITPEKFCSNCGKALG